MAKHNYKVGDKVKVVGNSQPMHYFKIGSIVTVETIDSRYDYYGEITLKGPVTWSSGDEQTQWLSLRDIEPVTPTHTLTPGQTYTSKNGTGWTCLFIHGDTAFMSSMFGPVIGDAYRFKMDGTNLSQGGGEWDIVFDPVRETVMTKGSWAKKGQSQPNHYQYGITFDLINGTPDWSTAKVTPCA